MLSYILHTESNLVYTSQLRKNLIETKKGLPFLEALFLGGIFISTLLPALLRRLSADHPGVHLVQVHTHRKS